MRRIIPFTALPAAESAALRHALRLAQLLVPEVSLAMVDVVTAVISDTTPYCKAKGSRIELSQALLLSSSNDDPPVRAALALAMEAIGMENATASGTATATSREELAVILAQKLSGMVCVEEQSRVAAFCAGLHPSPPAEALLHETAAREEAMLAEITALRGECAEGAVNHSTALQELQEEVDKLSKQLMRSEAGSLPSRPNPAASWPSLSPTPSPSPSP